MSWAMLRLPRPSANQRSAPVVAHFDIIALVDPGELPLEALQIAAALGDQAAKVYPVTTQAELLDAVKAATTVQPVIEDAQAIATIMESVVQSLNATTRALKDENLAVAELKLSEEEGQFRDSEGPFADIGRRTRKGPLSNLYELSTTARTTQATVLELHRTMVELLRSHDDKKLEQAWSQYDTLRLSYSQTRSQLVSSLEDLSKTG